MKFTLNIYDKRQVVKTYECEEYDLMYGTLEDFLAIIDLDMIVKDLSDVDFVKFVGKLVSQSMSQLKPLLLDVFEGMSEEELRKTKVKELVAVILQILKYSLTEIKGVGTEKNV